MVPRKTWVSRQDLEISEAFLTSLEVSFLYGLFLLFLSLETFYQIVLGSDFQLGSRRLGESRILPFATSKSLYFEYYATMPMLADAHISSLGYLWV